MLIHSVCVHTGLDNKPEVGMPLPTYGYSLRAPFPDAPASQIILLMAAYHFIKLMLGVVEFYFQFFLI